LKSKNGSVSVHQLLVIFSVSVLTPIVRYFPAAGAETAKRAAWVSTLLSSVVLAVIVAILYGIFGKNSSDDAKPSNIPEFFEISLGKTLAKVILVVYVLYFTIVFAAHTRYFSQRIVTSIFPKSDMRFFIAIMSALVFMALRCRIETFARFAEIMFIAMALLLLSFFVVLIPTINIENVYPVTYKDIVPAIEGIPKTVKTYGLLFMVFFIGQHTSGKNTIAKKGKRTVVCLALTATFMTFISLGNLGYKLVQKTPIPLFSALKQISFSEMFYGIESILISAWVVADFILMSSVAFAIAYTLKSLIGAREIKYLAAPIALFGFIGSSYASSSKYSLEAFAGSVFIQIVTFILYIALPAVALGIGKLRKVI